MIDVECSLFVSLSKMAQKVECILCSAIPSLWIKNKQILQKTSMFEFHIR